MPLNGALALGAAAAPSAAPVGSADPEGPLGPLDTRIESDGLEGLLGWHIGISAGLISNRLIAALEPLGIAPTSLSMLWLVAANPGLTQSDLAAYFSVARGTIFQSVRPLRVAGWIELRASEADSRSRGLYITAKGKRLLARARPLILEIEKWVISPMGQAEAGRMVSNLRHLIVTLSGDTGA